MEFERDVLLGIGKWAKTNAEAIYGSRANPFDHPFVWGDVTMKDNNLYLFVRNDYESKDISLSGFKGAVSEITVLETNEK